jgi:hypothetical protein
MGPTTKFLAIIQPDSTIKVVGSSPRPSHQPPIEPLSVTEFVARSQANGIEWTEGRGNVLTTVADRFGATIIATRLQLR